MTTAIVLKQKVVARARGRVAAAPGRGPSVLRLTPFSDRIAVGVLGTARRAAPTT